MVQKCNTCKFYDKRNASSGKCKYSHAERNIAYQGSRNKVKVDNGWPTVRGEEKGCGQWKKI